jgi:uncharacterized protein YciI
MAYYVVTSQQGPQWVDALPMREQAEWTEHAAFVNAAMYSGSLLLGGPLGAGHPHRALLVVQAEGEPAVRSWLEQDPWIRSGVLRVVSVEAWRLLVSNDKLDHVLAEITQSSA